MKSLKYRGLAAMLGLSMLAGSAMAEERLPRKIEEQDRIGLLRMNDIPCPSPAEYSNCVLEEVAFLPGDRFPTTIEAFTNAVKTRLFAFSQKKDSGEFDVFYLGETDVGTGKLKDNPNSTYMGTYNRIPKSSAELMTYFKAFLSENTK